MNAPTDRACAVRGRTHEAGQGPLGVPALPTPRERIRAISVDTTQLLASLDSHTPQAVLEALADSHHHLITALAAYRAHDEYHARHRDDTIDGRHLGDYRDSADAVHGTYYYGAHRP